MYTPETIDEAILEEDNDGPNEAVGRVADGNALPKRAIFSEDIDRCEMIFYLKASEMIFTSEYL